VANFTRATEIDPDQGVVWAYLADAFQGLAGTKAGSERDEAMEQALAAYRKAVALNPNKAAFHNNYALALARGKKFEEARTELVKATELDSPNAGKYQLMLGSVLVLAGRNEEALSAFKNAAEAGNSEGYFHYGLGLAAQSSCNRRPDQPSSRDCRGPSEVSAACTRR
jgi:tetratricopeptide (TPR) repeat protein